MTQTGDIKVIIDLGNTRLKSFVFKNNAIISARGFKTNAFKQLNNHLIQLPERSYCIISSVIDYPVQLSDLLNNHLKTIILSANTPIPIKNTYKTPETLGKDRIAAAVAAWHEFRGSDILVIDAGTAITADIVTNAGEFLGGSISPGIQMRFKALNTFTDKLPLIKQKSIRYLTGTTTEESIRSGVINGIVAEIDGIINKYKSVYPDLKIVFGGGDSKFLHKRLKNSIFALPNMVMNGLHLILNYNIENKFFH